MFIHRRSQEMRLFLHVLIKYTFSSESGGGGGQRWFLRSLKGLREKINFSTTRRLQGAYPREWDDCNTFLWLFLMVVLISFVFRDLSQLLREVVVVVVLFPISHIQVREFLRRTESCAPNCYVASPVNEGVPYLQHQAEKLTKLTKL